MKNKILYLAILVQSLFMFSSCNNERTNTPEALTINEIDYPVEFTQGLDGHGGLALWNEMKHLEYVVVKEGSKDEKQIIDLENRKSRIENGDWTIGFDGKDAWVSPSKDAYGKGSARFYHNLIFYFYACPYVLADPGVNYEVREPIMMNGRKLIPVATSFNEGVGDAPKDEYIAHFDAETNEMYLLLYTVTYYSKEKGDKFGAIVFDEWETFNGLKLPRSMKGFKYADGQLGEQRYERRFENIKISRTKPDQSLFEIPENAEIDSLQ